MAAAWQHAACLAQHRDMHDHPATKLRDRSQAKMSGYRRRDRGMGPRGLLCQPLGDPGRRRCGDAENHRDRGPEPAMARGRRHHARRGRGGRQCRARPRFRPRQWHCRDYPGARDPGGRPDRTAPRRHRQGRRYRDPGPGRQSRGGRPRAAHHLDGQPGRLVPDTGHHRARGPQRRGYRRVIVGNSHPRGAPPTGMGAIPPLARPLIVHRPSPSARDRSRAGLEPATPEKTMFIQTEATPNPATLKFIPGRAVLDSGTMEFANREAATRSPLAERLFDVPGVTGVFYGSDFVTVTKDDGDWQHLKPAILGAIMEHYMSGAPLLADGSVGSDEAADEQDEFFNEADAETVATIKDLIETRVRPAVASDGGDITFRGFKDGIVYLNMKGSCAGCPSSTATLQHGIQNLLRHFVPDVVEVRPV